MSTEPIQQLREAIVAAAEKLGLKPGSYQIEDLGRPHRRPKALPAGKAAVYIFAASWRVLKVGKGRARERAALYLPAL
jgi:hypothetical protein